MAEYIEREEVMRCIKNSKTLFNPTVRPIFDVASHLVSQVPAADVVPLVHGELRVEVTTEGFLNAEVATQRGWYRKCYFCPSCNQQLKEEMYEKDSCFMSWCVVRDESPMHYCPNCGARIDGE